MKNKSKTRTPRRWLTMPLGHYVDKNTAVHRLKPTTKIVLIMVAVVVITVMARTIGIHFNAFGLAVLGVEVLVTMSVFALARIPLSVAASQLLPVVPVLAFITIFQAWSVGWWSALSLATSLVVSVALALILTLTTRIGDMIESLDLALRPLARFHIPVNAISVAIAITIRLIPLQMENIRVVIEARRARSSRGLRAFALPVIIHSIRRAEAMGEALESRGFDDWDPTSSEYVSRE
ncbi:energy-coupling factor transporter transmembrane protein EcfT [Corynebacterium sp. SFY-M4]|uniref:energy-coupling factor transporter transmembrane component T family protein n=1 Tax=Corynebacterium sp. SFY-M4 TaxID=3092265 RepID=UPI00298DDE8A|nr:energy-coupling factor transporter transmembrane protein EcfT [Corynebacterium sp. SFY-M4]